MKLGPVTKFYKKNLKKNPSYLTKTENKTKKYLTQLS